MCREEENPHRYTHASRVVELVTRLAPLLGFGQEFGPGPKLRLELRLISRSEGYCYG